MIRLRYHDTRVPAKDRVIGDCWRNEAGHYVIMTPAGCIPLGSKWHVTGEPPDLTVTPDILVQHLPGRGPGSYRLRIKGGVLHTLP